MGCGSSSSIASDSPPLAVVPSDSSGGASGTHTQLQQDNKNKNNNAEATPQQPNKDSQADNKTTAAPVFADPTCQQQQAALPIKFNFTSADIDKSTSRKQHSHSKSLSQSQNKLPEHQHKHHRDASRSKVDSKHDSKHQRENSVSNPNQRALQQHLHDATNSSHHAVETTPVVPFDNSQNAATEHSEEHNKLGLGLHGKPNSTVPSGSNLHKQILTRALERPHSPSRSRSHVRSQSHSRSHIRSDSRVYEAPATAFEMLAETLEDWSNPTKMEGKIEHVWKHYAGNHATNLHRKQLDRLCTDIYHEFIVRYHEHLVKANPKHTEAEIQRDLEVDIPILIPGTTYRERINHIATFVLDKIDTNKVGYISKLQFIQYYPKAHAELFSSFANEHKHTPLDCSIM